MRFIEKYKKEVNLILATLAILYVMILYNYYESNRYREAILIKIDNKEIGYIMNKEEGRKILENLIAKQSKDSGLKNVQYSKIKNKITYTNKKVEIEKIQGGNEILEKLKSKNEKTGLPMVCIEIKGNIESTEVIAPVTAITVSNELIKGQSKVISQGSNGLKNVVKEVVVENNRILSQRVLREVVIEKPKDKIILNGNKNPVIIQSAVLTIPSRGSLTSNFGLRSGRQHQGVDIGAALGTPIYAASDGIISYANWMEGYGKLIRINHGNGIETMYGHCNSIDINYGERVKRGEKIGTVGSTGNSTGPHVHFEVRINGTPQNPMEYLK